MKLDFQAKEDQMGGTLSTHGRENAYMALVGKPECRRSLGRPRLRLEDNNKMDLKEIECGDMDWIDLAQDWDQWRSVVNTVMSETSGLIKYCKVLE
jgi:hypothetical protein